MTLLNRGSRLAIALALVFSPLLLRAQLIVDCSGGTPGTFPSINAALTNATPGSSMLVTGTCNESVFLQGLNGLNLGAWWGQTATIKGTVSVSNSTLIYLYGLNVTNPTGDGFNVSNSRSVVLDSCTSNGNAGVGLRVNGMSDVSVVTAGAFDNNASGGINIFGNSSVSLNAPSAIIDISNNTGPGVWVSQAEFGTLGNTTIANNLLGSNGGDGIVLLGGARAQVGGIFGPNTIQGNAAGGASIGENSEISFFSFGQPNIIQSNGPTGVSVNLGSQATFFDGVQITGHSEAGVDVYANSQANFSGANTVQRNGTLSNPLSAGIRVDGNSELFMRGGDVSVNNGPGVLGLVNSSADFTGVTFSGNSAGIIACDSSASMVSDLVRPGGNPPYGVVCKTPHALGNRRIFRTRPAVPDWSAYKVRQAKYKKLATKR
jgi:Right handed beta helix region